MVPIKGMISFTLDSTKSLMNWLWFLRTVYT